MLTLFINVAVRLRGLIKMAAESQASPLLCPKCSLVKEIWETGDLSPVEVLIAPDFPTLRESARNGCQLCQIVHQDLVYTRDIMKDKAHASIALTLFDNKKPELSINLRTSPAYSVSSRMKLSTTETSPHALGNQKLIHKFTSHTSDIELEEIAAVGALARDWISNCCLYHVKCKGPQDVDSEPDGKTLPTRLVDVGIDGTESVPKLVETANKLLGDVEYFALSYAWGGKDFPAKLTSSRIHQMRAGIQLSDLPKTIQHALYFTRKLGVRYLWVDALCIIQAESLHDVAHLVDWQHEAARFGQYYQKALVTIAATGAEGSDGGLFLDRPGLEFDPDPLPLTRRGPQETLESSVFPSLPEWPHEVHSAPLYRRGWATQERLLSTRILHFAKNCVLWECRQVRATEAKPGGLTTRDCDFPMTEEVFISRFKDLGYRYSRAELMKEWTVFIHNFMFKRFTRESDRLPALSGIAAIVQERLQSKYFAGIWESNLVEGLSWMMLPTDFPDPENPVFIAPKVKDGHVGAIPSWSWASVSGETGLVALFWKPKTSTLQLEDFTMRTRGPETSGQILEARLRVRGKFRTVRFPDFGLIHRRDNTFESDKGLWDRPISHAHLDAEHASEGSEGPHPCILLGHTYSPPNQNGHQKLLGGALILEPTGRRDGGVEEFRRIGFLVHPIGGCWSEVDEETSIDLV